MHPTPIFFFFLIKYTLAKAENKTENNTDENKNKQRKELY